jgi:NAD(P)-dependent dehydrogenase (short-subunit alcohol dehydrogenase family)
MEIVDTDKRVAIVTGAAQGIGLEIATHLAREGFVTIIVDINERAGSEAANGIRESSGEAAFISTDLARVGSIQSMVNQVVAECGRIDVLVNNAGILHTTAVEDITLEEWDRIIRVNLSAVFFTSQKVLPHLKRASCGRIINIASLAGRMGGIATGLAYTASKAGVIGLTRGMALRVAQHNITVNAIAPSTTEGPMSGQFADDQLLAVKSRIPLGRFAKPAEVAAAVVFLASPDASYITGAVLDVNGGIYMG